MSFSEKVVLITGASSGIGAAAALHLASLGAKVAIVGRNGKRLLEVADRITNAGYPEPLPIVADVTEDAERVINETIKHFGKLDVLVNNAGIFNSDSVLKFNIDEFDRIFNTNLRSVIILTNLAIPYLEKTRGNIINVSSVAGLKAFATYTSYCISKAALDQFTKCAALALASKGIRVNSINPGMVKTPIFESVGVTSASADAFYDKKKSEFLVGRVGEVQDTSNAIAYLASETFVNAINLPIDGGFLCGTRSKESRSSEAKNRIV